MIFEERKLEIFNVVPNCVRTSIPKFYFLCCFLTGAEPQNFFSTNLKSEENNSDLAWPQDHCEGTHLPLTP